MLVFVDASHFVLGAYPGYVWSVTPQYLPASSGRSRFNVLGGLIAGTNEVITVTNTTYITSESVCTLIDHIVAAHHQDEHKTVITLILDNARYQHCQKVTTYADMNGVDLVFLPPYSPQYNLIERFWKFVKKEVIYSTYYDKFADFCAAIDTCITQPTPAQQEALRTLLTLNFPHPKSSNFCPV